MTERKERRTPSQQAMALLKTQWSLTLAEDLRDVADALPKGHLERPGLLRAAEIVKHYGPDSPVPAGEPSNAS